MTDERPAVCMFVYNNCLSDQRVLKEARTVAHAGYRVTIVAVLDRRSSPIEVHPDFTIVRIDRDPLHYRLLRRTRQLRRGVRVSNRRQQSMRRRFARASRRRRRWIWRLRRYAAEPARRRANESGLVAPRRLLAAGLGVLAVPAVGYRAARWRAVRRMPWLLRYRRCTQARLERLMLRRARSRARRRLDLDPEGVRAELAWAWRPELRPLVPRAGATRPVQAVDRLVSSAAYRSLMAFHRPLMFTDYYRRALEAVIDEGYAVFQAHDVITLPVAALAAHRTGARLIYDSHELYTEVSTLSPRERRVWRAIERRLIPRADRVLTVCDSIADELAQRYGVPRPEVLRNCPEGVDAAPPTDCGRLRAAAQLGTRVPIVLYQGGFALNRGIEQLIDAAAMLDEGVIVLMGWGTIEEDLRDRISRAGLSERVRMVGPARPAELLEFTAGADIGVIPYRAVGLNNYYTTPNKLFEYIAAGVPVAGSDFPELRRVIKGEALGVTFDPEQPASIAAALNELLADPARLEEMRANAREARKRYIWESEALTLINIYADLTPPGARPAVSARQP